MADLLFKNTRSIKPEKAHEEGCRCEHYDANPDKLYMVLFHNIELAISYYQRKKKLHSRICKIVRFLALLALLFSVIFPLFYFTGLFEVIFLLSDASNIFAKYKNLISSGGYIWIGLCGVFLTIERVLGSSKAWFRYVNVFLDLQSLLVELELGWAKLNFTSEADSAGNSLECKKLELIIKFSHRLGEITKKETGQWNATYSDSLQQLHSHSNKSS